MFAPRSLSCAAVLLGLTFAAPTHAGTFAVDCYTDVTGCADLIADIVSDKFTARFPSTQYKIVITAEFQKYSDGGGVGFAIAGVSRKDAKGNTDPPINRFTVTRRVESGVSVNSYQVRDHEKEMIRRAVEYLMADCDNSPTCDVFTEHK